MLQLGQDIGLDLEEGILFNGGGHHLERCW